ncbi:MAG: membrane protein insertion efficiency factor YidD [Candidatus Methylomirabilales bacterium]
MIRGNCRFLTFIASLLIRLYQRRLAPQLPVTCSYKPTCSQYMLVAIQKHGVLRGIWRGISRLNRCRPGRGGIDYP